MPHNGGHTTIEMADRRSPNRSPHPPHREHEEHRTHRGPLPGAHSPSHTPSHGPSHTPGHGPSHTPGHAPSHTPTHGSHAPSHNGHLAPSHPPRTRRSPSPSRNATTRIAAHGNMTASNNSLNHSGTDDNLPLLSRGRRATPPTGTPEVVVEPVAERPPLTLHISPNPPGDKAQPLLETDAINPRPPLAGSEIDDLSGDSDIPNTAEAHPGVDDGFFNNDDGTKPEGDNTDDEKKEEDDEGAHQPGSDYPLLGDKEDGDGNILKIWVDEVDGFNDPLNPNGLTPRFGVDTPFPYAPEFSPGVQPRVIPDVNVYQQKKNLAQGMMDLALLSANANQLRYVLEAGDFHPYYYPSLIFISASLILQIGVGVGLIVNSTYNVKEHDDICKADKINNFTVIGIFLITVVNVFIASFGVAQIPGSNSSANANNQS